jgi:hypothetical protein
MGQLPLVDVCDVTRWDDELEGLGVVLVVAVVALVAEASSDSSDSRDSLDDVPPPLVLGLAAAVCVVVAACPSCQASRPPSESMEAMLNAAAALRDRAARGLRDRRAGAGGEEVGSSMPVNVRTRGERPARGA